MIRTWFLPASKDNCTHLFTATEIADRLAERSTNSRRTNPVQVGKVLKKLGFPRVKYRGGHCYPVKLKTYTDVEMVQRGITESVDKYSG